MNDCVFCKIAQGSIPSQVIWENEDFLAFLDIFPPVPGATVVIPKKHMDSYIKNANPEFLSNFMEAIKKTMDLLDTKLEGNIRTKLVFEGLEVNHLHAKLWPMYPGVAEEKPQSPASNEELAKMAEKIKAKDDANECVK